MIIIGCDLHTRLQQIAMFDPTTGEITERCLDHENGDVERFYGTLSSPARVGMLRHRHKLVCYRTSVMNQLQGLAISERLCRRRKLWSQVGRKELEALLLDPWASRRRQELLQLLDQLNPWIAELDREVQQQVERYPDAIHLMKQPGVGPITALSFVLTIGPVSRFPRSKQVVIPD